MRKVIISLFCCTAILLAGYAGYRGFKVWKQGHLMEMARGFLAKSDTRNALLCVQQALHSNPRNIDATRMMANLTELSRSPSALLWRSRVVELSPGLTEDRLALARTALTFRDYAAATNALAAVSVEGKRTAGYHNVAGAVEAAGNQLEEAKADFMEAARLEPTNQVPQLNLAVVRLHGTNSTELQEARTALNRISADPDNPGLRCQALRELVADAVRFKQTDRALGLSADLAQATNSVFADRLMRLDVLRLFGSSDTSLRSRRLRRRQHRNPEKSMKWRPGKSRRTSPSETLAWLRSLPRATQTNQPVTLLIVECLAAQKDWRGEQRWLEGQKWAELEFVRHAFLARALREQDLSAAGKAEWNEALKDANDQKSSLAMLLRLAAQWKWQSEGEDILWTIVNLYPGERWATRALTQDLFAGGRTRPLMMFYSQQMKRAPSDLSAKNNLAMTALLLDAQELKPHDLAREVYQSAPTNGFYVATYAFSLHLQKKDADALKVMERLSPQALENPSIAGYYGLILKATGNGPKARVYLDWAFKSSMLPEERKMFEAARRGA